MWRKFAREIASQPLICVALNGYRLEIENESKKNDK